jgi:hypothetical protein
MVASPLSETGQFTSLFALLFVDTINRLLDDSPGSDCRYEAAGGRPGRMVVGSCPETDMLPACQDDGVTADDFVDSIDPIDL